MVSNPDQLIMLGLSGRSDHARGHRLQAGVSRPVGYTRKQRSSLRRRFADRLGSPRVRVRSRQPGRSELEPHAYLALEFTVDDER
jgi:hypothetical protein